VEYGRRINVKANIQILILGFNPCVGLNQTKKIAKSTALSN
jgi:hypothetical protein